MNCDFVFDVLTRGPFPTGDSSDAQVERHLTACHDCRQLAEALRPAVDLFHESVGSDAGADLPGYRGELNDIDPRTGSIMTMIKQAAVTPVIAARQRKFAVRFTSVLQLSAAAMFVGVLCFLNWTTSGSRPDQVVSTNPSAVAPISTAKYQPDQGGRKILVALGLPGACLPLHAASDKVAEKEAVRHWEYLCCTQCHSAANSHRPPINSVAMLKQSCEACHNPGG